MFNHNRGLWGYTGNAADGEPLTIQSTGMGGPSAAIVLHELIALGVTRAISVGTCGALDPALGLGDLVLAREAIAADGTSVALGASSVARADPALADALLSALEAREHPHHAGRIVSTDLFYEPSPARGEAWSAGGAMAVEMEAATLFAVGADAEVSGRLPACRHRHLRCARRAHPHRRRRARRAVEAMGRAAAAALAV